MKKIIKGLKNSQKLMVIIDGVGFRTTINGVTNMVFSHQINAVITALDIIATEGVSGYGARIKSYDSVLNRYDVDVQVSLID
jgi:hypothetical protein